MVVDVFHGHPGASDVGIDEPDPHTVW